MEEEARLCRTCSSTQTHCHTVRALLDTMPGIHRTELVIVVPMKALDRAKTRLRSILPKEARMALSLQMLRHVLHVCSELKGVAATVLCGPTELTPLAEEYGAQLLEGALGA